MIELLWRLNTIIYVKPLAQSLGCYYELNRLKLLLLILVVKMYCQIPSNSTSNTLVIIAALIGFCLSHYNLWDIFSSRVTFSRQKITSYSLFRGPHIIWHWKHPTVTAGVRDVFEVWASLWPQYHLLSFSFLPFSTPITQVLGQNLTRHPKAEYKTSGV